MEGKIGGGESPDLPRRRPTALSGQSASEVASLASGVGWSLDAVEWPADAVGWPPDEVPSPADAVG
jgi:hypothetical protein